MGTSSRNSEQCSAEQLSNWLKTPLGESLLALEAQLLEDIMDSMFGLQALQVGLWGSSEPLIRFARTQLAHALASQDQTDSRGASLNCELFRLPVVNEAADVVLLPHTLDYCHQHAHAILREANRVLAPHGQIVILGFKPGGLWGLSRMLPGEAQPPGIGQFISERRLADWLNLLDLKVKVQQRYFFRWPYATKGPVAERWEARGRRFWPELAACYLLVAQKRVATITPTKPRWRSAPVVGGSVAKPSARNKA